MCKKNGIPNENSFLIQNGNYGVFKKFGLPLS